MYIASIPKSYCVDKLVLQVKNPKTGYLYWDYKSATINQAVSEFGHDGLEELSLGLKVHDLTSQQSYTILNITMEDDNCYLNDLESGHSYQVHLGLFNEEKDFHTVLKSKVIELPRNTISDVLDEDWMTVKDKMDRIYLLSGAVDDGSKIVEGGYSSLDLIKELRNADLSYSSFELAKASN